MVARPDTEADRLPYRLISLQGVFQGLALTVFISVSAALFLVEFGSDALPYAYLGAAALTPAVSWLYNTVERRVRTGRLVIATLALSTGIFAIAWIIIAATDAPWLLFVLVVVSTTLVAYGQLVQNVQTSLFYDVREMRRVLPNILAFSLLGVILAGILIPLLLLLLPLTALLGVAALSGVAMTATAVRLVAVYPALFAGMTPPGLKAGWNLVSDQPGEVQTSAGLGELLGDRFFRQVLRYRFLSHLATLLVLYVFLDLVSRRFGQDPEAITTFFAVYEVGLRTVTVIVLLAVATPLLLRFGVRSALLANPVAVTGAVAAFLVAVISSDLSVTALLWFAVAARSLDMIITLSSTAAAVRTIYRILPPRQRFASISAVEGVAIPVATGFGGASLLVLTRLPGASDAVVLGFTVVVCVLWSLVGHQAALGYRQTLVDRLARPSVTGIDIRADVAENLDAAEQLVHSPIATDVVVGLDVLAAGDDDRYRLALVDLTATGQDPELIVEGLDRLADECRRGGATISARPAALARLDEINPAPVRAAAMAALVRIDPEEAPAMVEPHLDSPDRALRNGAVSALLQAPDHRAASARRALAAMAAGLDPADRAAAAETIGAVGLAEHRALVEPLLTDDDAAVRAAAITAAGRLGLTEATPQILAGLEHRDTSVAAERALRALGDDALSTVVRVLHDRATPPRLAARLVRALAINPSTAAARVIGAQIGHPDDDVRRAAIVAMSGFDGGEVARPPSSIRSVIDREAARATRLRATIETLADRGRFADLVRAAAQEADRSVENVFTLLSVLHGTPSLSRGYRRLRLGGEAAATARETIDSVLGDDERHLVASLVDGAPSLGDDGQTGTVGGGGAGSTDLTADIGSVASMVAECDDDWCTATAFHGLVSAADPAAVDAATLAAVLNRERGAEPGPFLADMIEWTERRGSGPADGGGSPMALVEKVAVLRRCTIFAETPDRVLAEVAARSTQLTIGPGERLISRGSEADAMYVIVAGNLEASVDGRVIATMEAGEAVGELAVFDDAPRAADVTAAEACELLRLERDVLEQLVADRPEVAQGIISALAGRLREQGLDLAESREGQSRPRS